MDIYDYRGIKDTAAASLQEVFPSYRKLLLIHAAITAGASLVLSLLNALLDHGIGGTGGLSGMDLRSILTALQSFMTLAMVVLLPLWDAGATWSAIRVVRHQKTDLSTLTRGLRRCGPMLRLLLLRVTLYIAVGMLCSNLGSIVNYFLPMTDSMMQVIQALQTGAEIDQAQAMAILEYLIPSLVATMVLYLSVIIHLEYRFRFAIHLAVDEVKIGAFSALRLSNFITKGSKWALFRLDLSLWWYYVLQGLLTVIGFGDVILALAGITLPIGAEGAAWLFSGVYIAGTLLLAWYAAPYIQTVYGTAYNRLREKLVPPEDNRE